MYSFIQKFGATIAPAVGAIHDAIKGEQGLTSAQLFDDSEENRVVKESLEFYIGGTTAVVAAATLLLCRKKKPVRRRRRKTTTRRRTYRRRK